MKNKMSFLTEFKEFISRGNVIDLAVGVIIGSAFTAIVTSLVNDIIMPVIGIIFGGIDFTGLKFVITPAFGDIPEAAIYYGKFIQNVVNFLLISFVIFLIIKIINRFHRKNDEIPAEPPKQSDEIDLLQKIYDLMKSRDEMKI